jgi:hypothetical protein
VAYMKVFEWEGGGREDTYETSIASASNQKWFTLDASLTTSLQQGPPKRRYPATTPHGVTTQKTSTSNITEVKASIIKAEFHFRRYAANLSGRQKISKF